MPPEQKSLCWMKDMVDKFNIAEELVMEPSAGTFKSANMSMLLPQHQWFVRCDVSFSCYEQALPSDVGTFAKPIMNEKSKMKGSEEVQAAAEGIVTEMDQLVTKRRQNDRCMICTERCYIGAAIHDLHLRLSWNLLQRGWDCRRATARGDEQMGWVGPEKLYCVDKDTLLVVELSVI